MLRREDFYSKADTFDVKALLKEAKDLGIKERETYLIIIASAAEYYLREIPEFRDLPPEEQQDAIKELAQEYENEVIISYANRQRTKGRLKVGPTYR